MITDGSREGEELLVDLATLDPELVAGPQSHSLMPGAIKAPPVRQLLLEPGSWDWKADRRNIGLLVLHGFLLRRLELAGRRSVELLGPGDLLRPYEGEFDVYAMVPSEATWFILRPTRLGVLDERFARWLGAQPDGLDRLLRRTLQRSRTLALRLALVKLPKLSARLHFLLWHLADRFGRRTSDGVMLQLPLSHDVLADLVSAQRPSVSTAMKELERHALVDPVKPEGWLLNGHPPTIALDRLDTRPELLVPN